MLLHTSQTTCLLLHAGVVVCCCMVAPRASDAEDIKLESVTVEAHKPPLLDSVAPATVVEVDEEKTAGRTVADFLEEVPGVQIMRQGSTGARESVTIRGSDGQQVLVLIEGLGSAASPQGGGADLSLVPLEAVETVEVYRGVKGALAGGGAMGGVVVVRLKKGGKPRSVIRATGGVLGADNPDSLGLFMSTVGKDTFFSYSRQAADGTFEFVDTNGARRTRRNNDAVFDKLLLNHSASLSSTVKLDLLASAAVVSRGSPGLEQYPTKQAREQSSMLGVAGRLHASRFPWAKSHTRLGASWNWFDWAFTDSAPYMPPPVDTRAVNHRFGLTAENNTRLGKWLQTGLEAALVTELSDVERAGAADIDEHRTLGDVVGVFRAGDRHSRFSGSARTRVTLSQRHGAVVVPSVEGCARLAKPLTLFAGGARSFRYASFDEMYFDTGGIRGDPDLEPEDMWGADTGLRLKTKYVKGELTGFYHWINRSILFLPVTPYQIVAQNTRGTRGWGVESALAAKTPRLGRFGVLTGTASLTWMETLVDETDKPLPLRSPWSGAAQVKLGNERYALYVSARFRSEFPLDRFNSRFEEGRVFLDAGASLHLGRGFRIAADARNLTDKKDAIDNFQYPLPGFAWFLTIEKSFDQGGEDEK